MRLALILLFPLAALADPVYDQIDAYKSSWEKTLADRYTQRLIDLREYNAQMAIVEQNAQLWRNNRKAQLEPPKPPAPVYIYQPQRELNCSPSGFGNLRCQ